MASIYGLAQKTLTLVSGTATKITFPQGSKEHLLLMKTDVAWVWANSAAKMTAGDTVPMKSGSQWSVDGPLAATDIWVKQTSGGPIDLSWNYLYPAMR